MLCSLTSLQRQWQPHKAPPDGVCGLASKALGQQGHTCTSLGPESVKWVAQRAGQCHYLWLCLPGEVTAPSQPTPVSSLVPQAWLSLQRLLALFVGGKKGICTKALCMKK